MDDNVRILRPPWVEELLDASYLLDTLMDQIPDQIYFKDVKSRFVRVSRALASRWGLDDPQDAVGKTDFDFFADEHAQKAFADEQRLLQTGEQLAGIEERETWQDGREAWVSTTKVPLRDRSGQIVGLFGISRDITGKKLAELRLAEQAAQLAEQAQMLEQLTLLDELTGLNNRRGLQTVGEQALYAARRAGTPVAILFIDIDGLKQINDTLGHAAGDDALRTIADVIQSSIRGGDVAARIGGDEFCVLLFDKVGDALEQVLEQITTGAQAARAERSLPFVLSATVGACEIDARTPGSLAQLLERADGLMYEQKLRRRSQPTRLRPAPPAAGRLACGFRKVDRGSHAVEFPRFGGQGGLAQGLDGSSGHAGSPGDGHVASLSEHPSVRHMCPILRRLMRFRLDG